jgi:hypothetical protein
VSQEMRCPLCNQLIDEKGKWNIHYIHLRTDGGSDNVSNLIMGDRKDSCENGQ